MIYIIHGEDVVSSREKLTSLKKENPQSDLTEINGENLSLFNLQETLNSMSLFYIAKTFIIENFLSKNTKNFNDLSDILHKTSREDLIIFWENK